MPYILRSGVVATLGEFGDFEEHTGGERDAVVTDHYPAGANSPIKLFGPITITDVVLNRAYDPTRDVALEQWVELYQRGLEQPRSITVVYRNAQGIILKSRAYTICKPKGIKYPEGKSGDGTPTMISVTCVVENTQ